MSQIEKVNEFYEYKYIGGINNLYGFKTDSEISYEIKFVPSGYIFADEHPAKDFTYEFIISVLENSTGKNPPLDRKMPYTIALIVQDFFQEYRNVGIYICDSSDDKQAFRFRKFNMWFNLLKGTGFLKFDAIIPEKNGVDIFTSLIMRTNNPNQKAIIDGYLQITEEATTDK